MEPIGVDVAVIGGGPAGLSTCLELSKKSGKLNIALFESEGELGGIPRTCHLFFGMRDLKRIYKGPKYARILDQSIRKSSVEIHNQTTVLKIIPDEKGEKHCLHAVSPF